jgi:hypothetical protein
LKCAAAQQHPCALGEQQDEQPICSQQDGHSQAGSQQEQPQQEEQPQPQAPP